jgi:type VI secretion system secreted protein VgrG
MLQGIDVSWELHRSNYNPREYCVQYRETDFNFVSRLMEEEGIFYFFRHSRNDHRMVIADTPVSHPEVPDYATLDYDQSAGGLRDEACVSSWTKTQELGPGVYSLKDYNYGRPDGDMYVQEHILDTVQVGKVTHKLKVGGNDRFEIYDYPGGYGICEQAEGERTEGEVIAKLGMEHFEMAQFLIRGESNIFNLTAGYKFSLRHHQDGDGPYVLTRVVHSASEGGFHSTDAIGMNHYGNTFDCIPLALNYIPGHTAVKPCIRGCQTAIVVGSGGEEIYTDDCGRIKVQFHWDRQGAAGDSSSCWIRVSTLWAGEQWGMIHLPRVGQEVIVDFLEGDPDCPIVVGSVYNGKNMPPYDLPGAKTQSGIKSRSSLGGSNDNFNEIRFEDRTGSEEIHVHAEKDLTTEVENDRTSTVEHDEIIKISHNRSADIGSEDSTNAGSQITLETGLSKIVMKSSGEIDISGVTISIKSSGTINAEADATHTIKGSMVMIN